MTNQSLNPWQNNPDDQIGRIFLLPPNQKGERHRASIKQKVIEISEKLDADQNTVADKVNILLDVGQGRSQAIISYYQVINYQGRLTKKMTHSTSSEPLHPTQDHLRRIGLTMMVASTM